MFRDRLFLRVGFGQDPVTEIEAALLIPLGCYPGLLVNFVLVQKLHSPTRAAVLKVGCPGPATLALPGSSLECTFLGSAPGLQDQKLWVETSALPQKAVLRIGMLGKAENRGPGSRQVPLMSCSTAPENSCTDSQG